MTPTFSPPGPAPARALTLALLSLGALVAVAPPRALAQANPPREQAPGPVAPPVISPTTPPAEPEPARRVIFLPESYKLELREEIKRDVLEQAQREGWAAPNLVPAWLARFRFSGDFRGRFDRIVFPPGNANGGEFPDFNAINTGKPFDVKGVDLANDRYLNVDQSRTRTRVRARLGVGVELGQGFSTGLRLGTGEGSTPVSNNQTLGASGGVFSKYQVWVDRAFLKYELGEGAPSSFALLVGRFDNPFLGTDLLWWDDLGFDGVAVKGRIYAGGGVTPFLTGGAFPIYTTPMAYPAERPDKFSSLNKWLYAAQLGVQWDPRHALSIKLAAAFYDFDQVQGRPSQPCDTNLSAVSCDGDERRPSFAQKGNTYMALRTPSAAALAAEASSLAPRYQYFGLASQFREVAATLRIDLQLSPALKIWLDGEYVRNTGFHKSEIESQALNNRGPVQGTDPIGPFVGGNDGMMARVAFGTPELDHRWDWRARLAYRRLASDAVLDALNDPEFGQGGTNLKGPSVEITLALANRVTAAARWYSADQVAGPKYAVDTLQFDLAARF
jgi:hypothetical protein